MRRASIAFWLAGVSFVFACRSPATPGVALPDPTAEVALPMTTPATETTSVSSRIVALRAGRGLACVALRSGHARCWGDNTWGELGVDPHAFRRVDAVPRDGGTRPSPAMCLAAGERAVDFGIGDATICVVLSSGQVRCFGRGQLGLRGSGDEADGACGPRGEPAATVDLGTGERAVSMAMSITHACVLLASGRVKCWGSNERGWLGLGDRRSRGDVPGTMGDALPAVDLGAGRTARGVSVGVKFSCALLDDGHVKCWGLGEELGLGSTMDRGGDPGQMGDALPPVDLGRGRTATALASGPRTTCALLDAGEVKCWGAATGAIGSCEETFTGDAPGEMGDALPPISLGTGRRARAISVALDTACAVLDDGSLKCWGWNVNGDLGVGDRRPHGCRDMGDALPAIDFGKGRTCRRVAAGYGTACAVLDDDSAKCWGVGGPMSERAMDVGD